MNSHQRRIRRRKLLRSYTILIDVADRGTIGRGVGKRTSILSDLFWIQSQIAKLTPKKDCHYYFGVDCADDSTSIMMLECNTKTGRADCIAHTQINLKLKPAVATVSRREPIDYSIHANRNQ